MTNRIIYLGKTAFGVLHALAQNNGRGFVSWGRRYAELSPGRAVVFSQVYHQVVVQKLITSKGQNAPGQFVLTDRGIAAYLTGRIESVSYNGPFLDEASEDPFTPTETGIPIPGDHKWARHYRSPNSVRDRGVF